MSKGFHWQLGLAKKGPLSKSCHISHNDETWHSCSYTLPKEDSKNIKHVNHVTHPLSSADISNVVTGSQQFLLYLKIQIKITF